ncbi:probable RNA methyltransferase CG1239 [Musca vetustissima]|uniref:probable RNA methyltransferase CG1239 n=1 Tax=Musca vetustissima TaxID=27455 RepID=UPI002AB5FB18|nr:probable RNA methyltransferase CG1239 [Musca vetustissima]
MNLKAEEVPNNEENQYKECVNIKRKHSQDELQEETPCKKALHEEESVAAIEKDVKKFSNLEGLLQTNGNEFLKNKTASSEIRSVSGTSLEDNVKNNNELEGDVENVLSIEGTTDLKEEIINTNLKRVSTNPQKSGNGSNPIVKKACAEKEEDMSTNSEGVDKKASKHLENIPAETTTKSPNKTKKPTNTFIPQSPKKRLDFQGKLNDTSTTKKKEKFIYGNYSQYYGYRNKDKDFHDIRLDVFEKHKELFENKQILDIGCNSGFITMEVAKRFQVKSITGLDIDKHLINQAIKQLTRHKKSLPLNNELRREHKFPFNVTFVHGNYVLKDAVLLEIERPQFDVILCLSITKWIHLNFGDDGLKLAFRRMFLQLRPKGIFILEAQPFDNYARRKKMTEQIFTNYKNMKFFPNNFEEYLLSSEVGFTKVQLMGVPDHCKKGFKRPIQIFYKP